jgi:aminopeptidase N
MVAEKFVRTLLLLLVLLMILPQTVAASVDALHYSINMKVMPEEKRVIGVTQITVNALQLESLVLELDEDLEINSTFIEGQSLDYSMDGKKIIIDFQEPLTGINKIRIEYEGTLDEVVEGHSWAYMDTESVYAVYESSWYPHVVDDRASALIGLQVPPGWASVSNGELVDYDEEDNVYVWEVETQEIGFSFAAGRYREMQDYQKHKPVSCFLITPKEGCATELKDGLTFFSFKLLSYPYPKLALTEVRGKLNGGHGDNSLIIMSSDIIDGPNFQEFLAHEAAHSWFGGMVTSSDSKWLTEGFATYAGILYLESKDRDLARIAMDEKRREYLGITENQDEIAILESVDEYDELFHATVYSKGAYVLHMLRYVVGDEVFSKTLQNYLEKYYGRSAGVEDFKEVAEATSGMELGWFFDEWLGSTSIPDFWIESPQVLRSNDAYQISAVLRQGEDRVKMPVDVFLITPKGEVKKRVWMNSTVTEFEFVSEADPILLEIDKEEWLLERNRLNNRHTLRYPLNSFGLRLFISNIILKFRAFF